MQDRFKFRFWNKTDKKMQEWNGCHLWQALNNECLIPMQCTGLKDKNCRLIYEGDILKFGEFYDNKWFSFDIGKVYWGGNMDYPAFEIASKTTDFDTSNGLSYIFGEGLYIEVIGNIYENPELLEAKND